MSEGDSIRRLTTNKRVILHHCNISDRTGTVWIFFIRYTLLMRGNATISETFSFVSVLYVFVMVVERVHQLGSDPCE